MSRVVATCALRRLRDACKHKACSLRDAHLRMVEVHAPHGHRQRQAARPLRPRIKGVGCSSAGQRRHAVLTALHLHANGVSRQVLVRQQVGVVAVSVAAHGALRLPPHANGKHAAKCYDNTYKKADQLVGGRPVKLLVYDSGADDAGEGEGGVVHWHNLVVAEVLHRLLQVMH